MSDASSEVILMGPVLWWPKEQGEPPVCITSCDSGWVLNPKTGYWVCPVCRKPGRQYLRVCEICEEVYLIEPWPTLIVINPEMPRVLNHAACVNYIERMASDDPNGQD